MLERGQVYHRRSDIHAKFGGQEQGGISTPRQYPLIFLFSSSTGEAYGYNDRWIDADTYRYSGEGQRGDMELVRGNRAIANHVKNGKELHLFEKVDKGRYRYAGQMEYVTYDVENRTRDAEGRARSAIVFTLRRITP